MNKKKRQKGFTLVEMLIYMGILTIFLVVLTQIFTSILDAQLKSESVSNVDHDARYIFSRLSYDIHRADSVIIPASLGETTQQLQLLINGSVYTYSLQNDILQVSNSTDTIFLNGFDTHSSGLSFTKIGNTDGKPTVHIQLHITSLTQNIQGATEKDIETTIGVR